MKQKCVRFISAYIMVTFLSCWCFSQHEFHINGRFMLSIAFYILWPFRSLCIANALTIFFNAEMYFRIITITRMGEKEQEQENDRKRLTE